MQSAGCDPEPERVQAFQGLYWNADRLYARRVSVESGVATLSEEGGGKARLFAGAGGVYRAAGSMSEIRLEMRGKGPDARSSLVETDPEEGRAEWTRVAGSAPPAATALEALAGAFYSD